MLPCLCSCSERRPVHRRAAALLPPGPDLSVCGPWRLGDWPGGLYCDHQQVSCQPRALGPACWSILVLLASCLRYWRCDSSSPKWHTCPWSTRSLFLVRSRRGADTGSLVVPNTEHVDFCPVLLCGPRGEGGQVGPGGGGSCLLRTSACLPWARHCARCRGYGRE